MYIWGGGKTSPQTLATFKKDLGAVRVCVAPKHFCVVTVEKELYVWSSGTDTLIACLDRISKVLLEEGI